MEARQIAAEVLGTAFLLADAVGSGIMAERLAGGETATAQLASSLATGLGLGVLILLFKPLSGSYFNPAISLCCAWEGDVRWRDAPIYVIAQMVGAFAGVALAHQMFGEPVFSASQHDRGGASQLLSEFVGTFGLLMVVRGCERQQSPATPFAVGAYISAASWFTASSAFANPAMLVRAATDSLGGIAPVDVPGFLLAQFAGAFAATALFRWLMPRKRD